MDKTNDNTAGSDMLAECRVALCSAYNLLEEQRKTIFGLLQLFERIDEDGQNEGDNPYINFLPRLMVSIYGDALDAVNSVNNDIERLFPEE